MDQEDMEMLNKRKEEAENCLHDFDNDIKTSKENAYDSIYKAIDCLKQMLSILDFAIDEEQGNI